MNTPQPCPNAKKTPGRFRYKGEKEYKCSMACAICRGKGMTVDCSACQGCGLVAGKGCDACRTTGRAPSAA